jgi:hypothetical protein
MACVANNHRRLHLSLRHYANMLELFAKT